MALTRELVARAPPSSADPGPAPGPPPMTDEDYELAVQQIVAGAPAGEIWLFAYGSLLWKPECEIADGRRAVIHGWHRAYCVRVLRFRGTVDRPGLMMSLDRGGQCHGMIMRLAGDVQASLHKLLRRELVIKPSPQCFRWCTAHTAGGPVRVITFAVNHRSERYVGKLDLDDIADAVATAAGHWGSCAEYLHETVARLEELGIHDRKLWRLQQLVAERLGRSRVSA